MQESLDEITKCIDWYKTAKNTDPHKLVEILRVISSHLYTLETYRSEYKKEYESLIFDLTNDGYTVARATNEAETRIPQLYMLRRIIEASSRVCDAIRTQVSLAKQEMTNSA